VRRRRFDWAKWGLGVYFVLFLIFLYAPMILMGVLSFQGDFGGITFPFRGPFSTQWWESLWNPDIPGSHADEIRSAGIQSLKISLAAGAVVALLAFTLSMAFRRRFRGEGIAFYLIMLALMTPGYLLGLGIQLFWAFMDAPTSLWKTALGANVIWGIPFGFLVMLAIWNRYDDRVEEAARDLGAGRARTFREVTLPLVWTGVFGAFLFGFTLAWNDYDRTVLLVGGDETQTLPLQIAGLTFTAAIRPDLYALGTATTLVSIAAILIGLAVAAVMLRVRGGPRVVRVEEELGIAKGLEASEPAGASARAK
jgi:putative spermidine/putrescine transport system permease protein